MIYCLHIHSMRSVLVDIPSTIDRLSTYTVDEYYSLLLVLEDRSTNI